MTLEARRAVELSKIRRFPVATQQMIKRNMQRGLLCACNAVLVPYFGGQPDGHGSKVDGGKTHGYTDCR